MKINKWIAGALVVCTGLVLACSGEETEKPSEFTIPDIEVLPGEDTTARELNEFNKSQKILTAKNFKIYDKLVKKYKDLSHFTVTSKGLLFLRISKSEIFASNGKYDDRVRFGLIDEKGKELLPMNCQQISNPGFVVKDMVEFKKDDKYGLYNYVTEEKIDAKYNVIYPSKIMEYIAIGEIDGKLFKIYKDGKQKAFTQEENAPNYFNLLKDFHFNYKSKFFAWWYTTQQLEYLRDGEGYDYEIENMIMPPSYLNQLNVYPNLMRGIYGQIDSLDFKPVAQVKRNDNIFAFTTSLFQEIAEARGYTEKNVHLVTIDKTNRVKQSVQLYTIGEYSLVDANELAPPSVKFINDSLIEVKNFIDNNEQDEQEFDSFLYNYQTLYEYYTIEPNGKITRIEGYYSMISAVELTRNHFKGSFSKFLSDEERAVKAPDLEDDSDVLEITDHLTVDDMQFIINELYARKGMKFTDDQLSNYFSQFDWYKPKYKSVDSKLTDIEKKNIQMIKRLMKDVKSNPSKFIHSNLQAPNAAG